MSRVVLRPEVLERLRKLGDDGLKSSGFVDPTLTDIAQALRKFNDIPKSELLPRTFKLDPEKLLVAQRLFGDYIAEISGALLLAALPQSYATEYGAAVLGAHGELTNNLTRRIGATAQFLLTVMQRGADAADQERLWDARHLSPAEMQAVADNLFNPAETVTNNLPWVACVRLRIFHQVVRNQLDPANRSTRAKKLLDKENTPALNQEDLLGMQLMFSFVVFEVLDRYGITWTADEQEAYLHLWDVIGAYLAIGSVHVRTSLKNPPAHVKAKFEVPSGWHGLRPPTIEQSRDLVNQIRGRQWLDPSPRSTEVGMSWTALRSGRVLARALLDELEESMPPVLKPLPLAVMRALSPDVVRRRLNLGGNGVLLESLTLLPKRTVQIAPFTSARSPNRLAGRVLRMMANDVTAHASVHLGEKYHITIPGAPDWHHTP